MENVIVTAFRSGGKTINARKPIPLTPIKEGTFVFYRLDAIGLDCHIFDERQPGIEIVCELAMLWRTYAMEADDKLDPEALQVKRHLHELFVSE